MYLVNVGAAYKTVGLLLSTATLLSANANMTKNQQGALIWYTQQRPKRDKCRVRTSKRRDTMKGNTVSQ